MKKTKLQSWLPPFRRDWMILVIAFAVGLIALSSFAWQIYLSDEIAGGYVTPPATATDMPAKIIDKKRLQADLLLLRTEQEAWLKLKANQPKLVDPSL